MFSDNSTTSLVIFGASGDLTYRKLIPSLFNLYRKNRLPEAFNIVGFGGTPFTDIEFRERQLEGVNKFAGFSYSKDEWRLFASHLTYVQGQYKELSDYRNLDSTLAKISDGVDNRLFYLATPPGLFPDIIDMLGHTNQVTENNGWRRVVIEKPFGIDLGTARHLNRQIHQVIDEKQIYRIDHYLGKETVQNILITRFANTIFEPIWNRNYIDHIQITVAEQVGVGHRGGFYDGIGVLRDMFQNHLLQLFTLVSMEPPSSFDADALRNEKIKVLNAINPITKDEASRDTVRAQYIGYHNEPDVASNSTTPTYAAVRFFIDNWRWKGVPFYLRSGKSMAEKLTQIIIQFKEPPHLMFPLPPGSQITPNMLVLYLQPDEGVHLRFEAKVPDTVVEMRSVDMEFQYTDYFGPTAIPESYERLLLDVLLGDAALFTRADEVEAAWRLIDPILEGWDALGPSMLPLYTPGSWGPTEADTLIVQDNRSWIPGNA